LSERLPWNERHGHTYGQDRDEAVDPGE